MVGSTFTIYSTVAYKSIERNNVSDGLKIFTRYLNMSNEMSDLISKKIYDDSNRLWYVTNTFHDLKAASIKFNMLDDLMKQYESNNYVPEHSLLNISYHSNNSHRISLVF